jgi:tungstate transport system ATP-binding protein
LSQPPAVTVPMLEAKHLSVAFGTASVLDVPLLQVRSNEVFVVIGPNGCGKTTLLLCLALLLKPTTGTISYSGTPVTDSVTALQWRRRMSVAFQDPLLLSSSVWENVTLGLRFRGIKGHRIRERAEMWLDRFGVGHLAGRQARTLSGGEAKRVSLARAFVLEPQVLFLDEPFNALDSPTRQALAEDFQGVLRETRVTTFLVTHDRNEALALADRVAVLIGGRMRQLGTPGEVFSTPVDEQVATFVEAGNIFRGVVDSQDGGLVRVIVDGQTLQVVSSLSNGTRVTAYLHYEDVTISLPLSLPVASSARNQLKGTIARVFPLGPQLKVTIDCGFPCSSVITRRSWEELGLEIGRDVVASFKASSVHLIPKL